MLGFTPAASYFGGDAHMTVCVGYVVENGTTYVFLSDAFSPGNEYNKVIFNSDINNDGYNDFMATVSLVAN